MIRSRLAWTRRRFSASRCWPLVLDGAQDSDDPGVVAALGMPMGLVAVPTGGVFVGGGTWPMTML